MMKKCPFGIECDDCRFYKNWILTNDKNEQKIEERCGIEVLMDEVPRIRGSVDGCQAATNEARNRVIEFGRAAVETIEAMPRLIAGERKRLSG